jgi:tetratricopeptide (TPR) repeat protein/serine/threonine protein kinase
MNGNEESVFAQALEIADLHERVAFLDRVSASDSELRRSVESLLSAYDAGRFLESPAVLATADGSACCGGAGTAVEAAGTLIGRYKLLQKIGEGGMGAVWMAEQTEPMQRKVALKIIKPGMDSAQVIARFEAERQALALMDHPNIARVFDAGTTGERQGDRETRRQGEQAGSSVSLSPCLPVSLSAGRPFFVMELVKGQPITKYCNEHHLAPRERLELFLPVCQAIQHAHQKGIIHRDIKPSNVLVAPFDGMPVVKVIDFGIAKAMGQRLTDKTLFTEFGAVVGTLEYMSPEQATLNNLDIDTRSDIYSLGVLLYELLTGWTPLDRQHVSEKGLLEVLRIIREDELPRPSMRLGRDEGREMRDETKKEDRTLPGVFSSLIPHPSSLQELDWIVMKALEKDRNRRYETAGAFADDIRRFLRDEPVQACPPSVLYRWSKFARRHRTALLTTAALVAIVLLAAGSVGWAWWQRADQEARRRQEWSDRLAETDRTASVALGKAEQWAGQAEEWKSATSQQSAVVLGIWDRGDAALAEAEAALRTGVAEETLRQRVLQVRRRLERGRRLTEQVRSKLLRKEALLHALDEARLRRATWVETTFDAAGAAAQYQAVFAAHGLEVKPQRRAELARRIRAEEPAVCEALIVALDDWSFAAGYARTNPSATTLQALAADADDDVWRKRFRAACAARDRATLKSLSAQARPLSLSASSVEVLALCLFTTGEWAEALTLLRWGRGCHPTDFWLPMQMGNILRRGNGEQTTPVNLEERIGCFRVAVALRPNASAARNNLGVALHDKGALDDAIAEYRRALTVDPRHFVARKNLGHALHDKGQLNEAIAEFRKALAINGRSAEVLVHFGAALHASGQVNEATAEFRKAIALNPQHVLAHFNLGNCLRAKGLLDDAIAEYRRAIAIKPDFADAHFNLGMSFRGKGRLDEAISSYREAIAMNPKLAPAHYNLGNCLRDRGQLDEAIACYRKFIAINPHDADVHNNLGYTLRAKGRLDDAIAECRTAIAIDPKCFKAHNNLGNCFRDKGRLDEAIACYRKAIAINPRNAVAHHNLGLTLVRKGQLDDAIAEYREAIRLNKDYAEAHYNMGNALSKAGRYDEAIAEYEKAITIKDDFAEPHCNLGLALQRKGQFTRALAELRRGHELGPRSPPWRYPSDRWVRECERLVELDKRLPALLEGKAKPASPAERIELGELCSLKQMYRAAARFYEEAFAAEPALASPKQYRHLYGAACAAALAGCGAGKDSDRLDAKERGRLRRQALSWLRADLEESNHVLDKGPDKGRAVIVQQMRQWLTTPDLAGVRGSQAIARLPDAERPSWQQLWGQIADTLARAQGKATPREKPPAN